MIPINILFVFFNITSMYNQGQSLIVQEITSVKKEQVDDLLLNVI